MSVQRWASRCANEDCSGRWAIERHSTVTERALPGSAEIQTSRWIVQCEHGHSFLVKAVKQDGEYLVVVP